jgi:hypothetical protein
MLFVVWALLGALVVVVLCSLVFRMLRPTQPQPLTIAQVEDFPENSVTLKFVNAAFSDPVTQKDFTTLALEIVRASGDSFTVFFARSTNPVFGGLTPRQCVVAWDDTSHLFVDPCGSAKWARDGKYSGGPAPRDMDRFPAQVKDGNLTIELDLIMGGAAP